MAGVGLGVSRAWYTKVRFQAGKPLGGGGQRGEIPGRVVNPRTAGRRREGMILLLGPSRPSGLPPREFFMARIASGEGAWSWVGSLSNSDCGLLGGPHRRTEGVQVSGLISEVQAQVPTSQGASSPHTLILSGLWGRSGDRGCRKTRNTQHLPPCPQKLQIQGGAQQSSSAPSSWLAGAGQVRALASPLRQRQGKA